MSHTKHYTQPSTTGSACSECGQKVAWRGLCIGHARAADSRDEWNHFLGYHATDERTGIWMRVKADSVERERMRRQAAS